MVGQSRHQLSKSWSVGFVAAVSALVAAYFSLPGDKKNTVFNVIAVAAAAAMFFGIAKNRAKPRFAWMLLASGTLLMAVGDIVFGSSTQPVPSVADMLYVSAYVALTLGFVGLIRSEFPSHRASSRLDAIVLAAGVAIVGILLLIVPAAHPDGVGIAAQAVSLGYPALDLILLLVLFKPAHRGVARRTTFFLWPAACCSGWSPTQGTPCRTTARRMCPATPPTRSGSSPTRCSRPPCCIPRSRERRRIRHRSGRPAPTSRPTTSLW